MMRASKTVYKQIAKENRKTVIWLTLLSSFFSVFLVGFAYHSKLLLDSITTNKDKLPLYASVLGGFIVLEVCLKLLTNISYSKCTLKLENKIKKETLFSYIQNEYYLLDNKNSADWINRITSDSKVIADGIISFIPNTIALCIRIIASFAVLLIIDWKFATALLIIGFIGFGISKVVRRKNKELHKLSQKQEDVSLQFYKNSISHFFLIKLYNCEAKIEKQCDVIQDNYAKAKLKIREFSIFINTAFSFIMRLSYIGAILYVAISMANNVTTITYGSLLAMVQLVSQIEVPFTSLSGLLPRYYQTLGSIERIEEYKPEHPVTVLDEDISLEDSIDVNGLTFSYKQDRTLFANLNLKISKGDFILIKGHSGCGKTTLIKILMGMYKPVEGSVTYKNEDISKYSSLFAYVPQGNFLINGTVKDNLCLFSKKTLDDKTINEALEYACLKDKINSLPKGLDTVLGDDGSGFSIGEGQRLSIARALLTGRDVLVLDEASSSLDIDTAEKVMKNLTSLGKTIIMVSHKNESNSYANKVIDLESDKHGRK